MARTSEEWSALLGSALSKMALVRGSDSPDAYLPDDCYPVIQKVFEVAMNEARGQGYAEAMRDIRHGQTKPDIPNDKSMLRLVLRAFPKTQLFA